MGGWRQENCDRSPSRIVGGFIAFLISREGQKVIAGYKIDGQQFFYPNANNSNA
jgi:ABC-type tungstate transport system permease subunit